MSCRFVLAEGVKELKGDDWARMLQDEKLEFVSQVLRVYEDEGLTITKSAKYYAFTLNTAILGDSANGSENVADILNAILYQNEPSLQPPSKKPEPQIQKIEMH